MTFVVVFVQLVAASEILGATLPTAAKSGEIQTPSRAQARVLVPLAAGQVADVTVLVTSIFAVHLNRTASLCMSARR